MINCPIPMNNANFLKYIEGVRQNCLNNIIDTHIDQSQITHISSYYDSKNFSFLMNKHKNNFSVLSSNIQSINSKFSELEAYLYYLNESNFHFSAIALQESWLSDDADLSQLQLTDYKIVMQGKQSSTKGGLIMYIHNSYQVDTIKNKHTYNNWEYHAVRVKGGDLTKSIILVNIYRPPNELVAYTRQFIDEFNALLSTFDKINSEIILTGDFYINLLKINENAATIDYYGVLIANGFIPKISPPTRLTDTGGTLIDNLHCKMSKATLEAIAGIMTLKCSDHQPYFIFIDTQQPKAPAAKFITINDQSEHAAAKFKIAVQNLQLFDQLDHNPNGNPRSNYETLITNIQNV